MRLRAVLSLLLFTAPIPAGLTAQAVPVGDVVHLCPVLPSYVGPGSYTCGSPDAAVLTDGSFLAARDEWLWGERKDGGRIDVLGTGLARIDASGRLVATSVLDRGSVANDYTPEQPAVAADGTGGYVAAWHVVLFFEAEIVVQRFDEMMLGEPREGSCNWSPRVAANAKGQFAVAWEHSEGCDVVRTTVWTQAFASARAPATPILHLAPKDPADSMTRPLVWVDPAGRFVVLWTEKAATTRIAVLRGQRFGRDGRRLGPTFEIAHAGVPAVLPDGTIVVAWSEPVADGVRLLLGFYTHEGVPLGPAVEAGAAFEAVPLDLAADRHGNLALLWDEGDHCRARLFNRDLVPQGDAIWIGSASSPFGDQGALALSDAGRLLAVWTGAQETPEPYVRVNPVLARVWKAPHDADACVRRANRFLCDTAGNGGEPEASLTLGTGHPREIPFLADWDGDGRADPCLYRGGSFACDTAHDGGLAEEHSPIVGAANDVPLLGDLDGDGKADPCVRRDNVLLCDRARDGGAKDLKIIFGLAADRALLGDIDGDGRDDPCLYRQGRFLCDRAHNGGTAEVTLDLRSTLAGGTGGVPLLGDVNGDGRDDACVWTAGRLLCGIFPVKGGTPLRVIERLFGNPGDLPLLGDLDAF